MQAQLDKHQKLPFPLGMWTPSNAWFLEATLLSPIRHLNNDNLNVANTHTHRQTHRPTDRRTDHATLSAAIRRYR